MNLNDVPEISFINNETVDDVVAQMIADYRARYLELTGTETELNQANPYRLILYACAMQLYQIMQYIDFKGKQNFLKYASGDFLDNLVLLRGVSRRGATSAMTVLQFSIDSAISSAVSIPEGTLVTNGDGIYFATDEYAEIPAGSTSTTVTATCTVTGTSGTGLNIGALNQLVDTLPYITAVTNLSATSGGANIETDDELRERAYTAADAYATTGTAAAYIYHVKELSPDIEDVVVTTPTAGTVDIRFTMTGGEIPDASMIAYVLDKLSDDNIRPLTDTVTVHAPTTQTYNVNITYYIARSNASSVANIQSEVTAAVAAYNAWQTGAIGRDINPSQLISRVVNAGAKRVAVTSPTNTVLEATALAKTGTVTVTYGGLEDD